MKKIFLALQIFFLLFLMGGCNNSSQKNIPDKKSLPNIILYVVDDLGTNDAGCYGNKVINTPGIDALAKEGTLFNFAFCTTPTCSASRSVILTGKYNHANGQYGHSHFEFHFSAFDNIKSLPIILDSAGYRTMRVGKFHIAPEKVFHFQNYHPKKAEYPDEVWKAFNKAPIYPFANSRSPEVLAEDMREFITNKSGSPFFLYFATFEPHSPYPREGSKDIKPEDVIVPDHLPDIPEIRDELSKYYMSAERGDKGLLKLIEILKETGQWDNTIILFTSDNGRPFPGAKANLYEPGIKLPFVFRNPLQDKQGIVTNAMINFADITPTLLDFAGVDIAKYNFHGRSFKSQLSLEKSVGFDTVFASHTFHEIQMYYPMRMIRDRNYKFIWNLAYEQNFPLGVECMPFLNLIQSNKLEYIGKRRIVDYLHRPKFELYDLLKDPNEIDNLAYNTNYAELLKFYKNRIFKFQNETGDVWNIYQDYEELEDYVNKNIK